MTECRAFNRAPIALLLNAVLGEKVEIAWAIRLFPHSKLKRRQNAGPLAKDEFAEGSNANPKGRRIVVQGLLPMAGQILRRFNDFTTSAMSPGRSLRASTRSALDEVADTRCNARLFNTAPSSPFAGGLPLRHGQIPGPSYRCPSAIALTSCKVGIFRPAAQARFSLREFCKLKVRENRRPVFLAKENESRRESRRTTFCL